MTSTSTNLRLLIAALMLLLLALAASFFYFSPSRTTGQTSRTDTPSPPPEAAKSIPLVASATKAPSTPTRILSAPQPKLRIDDSIPDFAKQYSSLEKRAQDGDVEAAKALYNGLRPCVDAPRTQADVDALVNLAGAQYEQGSEDYKSAVAYANISFQHCSLLTLGQRDSYRHWLALAAHLGDSKARLDYVNSGAPSLAIEGSNYGAALNEYRELANQYLHDEIRAGNADALAAASEAYANQQVFAPDLVKQYAYLYAYVLATGSSSGVFFDGLAILQSRMQPEEVATATSQGQEIYQACCRKGG